MGGGGGKEKRTPQGREAGRIPLPSSLIIIIIIAGTFIFLSIDLLLSPPIDPSVVEELKNKTEQNKNTVTMVKAGR